MPEEVVAPIFLASGNILFLRHRNFLYEVEGGMVKANITELYSSLIKFATIPYQIRRASRL